MRQRLRQLHRLVRTPFTTIFMILLLIAMFYHTALGLQVVIEEYDHSGAKIPALVATRLGCFALAAAGIVATLRISPLTAETGGAREACATE
jgi:succinate dehydrogenase / fumarate reductase, membrane anchor subunit